MTIHVNIPKDLYNQKRPSTIYSIQDCVGRGNFGDVYKAIDKLTGEIVAIKVVNLESSDEDIELIAQEIFFLAELKSPYITNYITTMLEDVSMWIVMEYCGGGSCSDLIRYHYNEGLHEDKVAFITKNVLRGLQYLHEQRKIHRDVKAANVLLTDDGLVKLADFGVSGQLRSTAKRNTFVGTPYWMAPEIISNSSHGYNEKADIWSLGITVYELLKGCPPYAKYDAGKVMRNIPKKNLQDCMVSFSDAAKLFISACLIKDPDERPTATELLQQPFVKNIKITDLRNEVMEIKRTRKEGNKVPKYSLDNRLYQTFSKPKSGNFWNFDSVRLTKSKNLSKTEESPISASTLQSSYCNNNNNNNNSSSNSNSNHNVTPITNATTPSFREYDKNAVYGLGSGMEIDTDLQSPQIISDEKKESNFKQIDIDYLKNVICYCLKRMHDRANEEETRKHVDDVLNYLIGVEMKVPGFSEVLIEEVELRMDTIKQYLAQ
ncbi:putative serine/threonine protein kinase SPS1 NDAI_0F04520 [Naumovozyma dairenensis CBS 421]|uniref:non-specific serine/threonine protein kinase n=1 Tax=Naumovozyma dairenensis (strain ATCC 10597 / BCRC 20456 / CBS 421 / NBRC 0211 / NRRL Y-12639) TaxID=1071378 RepID=G0WDA9_NAUDC|nr:hypothetical protein NDAI_0F04520 [Naumovozyma dairenensis CBS 421]CCD25770.1 hypothetical protein NDAI_0F04520 [Naumovozyma dairenensis CBS 421]